jgi:hypothetical protein
VVLDTAFAVPVPDVLLGVEVIGELGGVLVGVYLTPLKFVQLVNLPVALPTTQIAN